MIQTINLGDTEKIMFNSFDVENLRLDNNIIWSSDTSIIPESMGTVGLVYTGIDTNGYFETDSNFDGTIVAYMIGTGDKNVKQNGIDKNLFDYNLAELYIPSFHNGLPVKGIGVESLTQLNNVNNGYTEMPNLKEIKIGYNVEYIGLPYGGNAIGAKLLNECKVYIPNSVTEIRKGSLDYEITVDSYHIYDNRLLSYNDADASNDSASIDCDILTIGKDSIECGNYYDVYGGLSKEYQIIRATHIYFEDRTKQLTFRDSSFAELSKLLEILIPNQVYYLPNNCFNNCKALSTMVIPQNIKSIGDLCFNYCSALVELRFNHSISDEITLPSAGSSTGMLYSKSAKTMTIYTDNETVKNYNYAGDNITATVLHLDGTEWD